MDKLIAAVLLALAGPAAAIDHTMDVRVSRGMALYTQDMKLSDGQQLNFNGPVAGGRSMIFNAILASDPKSPRESDLQYQLEVSGGPNSQAPILQVQSTLRMRSGASLISVDCGAWTVELSLDTRGSLTRKKPDPAAAWDDHGLGNYRITADMLRGPARQRCRLAIWPGTQANVVDGTKRGDRKYGFIFNALPAAQDAGVGLQYQLEYTPAGMPATQIQNQEVLTPGRRSKVKGQGYTLELLAEGGPPMTPAHAAKPAAPAPAPAAPPADMDTKAAPLLR